MAAKNDNNIYVIFPCRKIDLKDNREEYTHRLLAANRHLGLMRFEIDSHDMVKLVLPLANEGMTAEKLNRSIRSLLDTAKNTSAVWSNKPAKSDVKTSDDMSSRNVPSSGSAPPGSGSATPGTVPTKGSSPSAGTVPHQASLKIGSSDICKDGNMRIGSMSMKDSSYFGTIIFGPDGSFAGSISNSEGTYHSKDKGTWEIVDGQLEVTIGNGDKIRFETKSNDNGKLKLQSSDGAMVITLA